MARQRKNWLFIGLFSVFGAIGLLLYSLPLEAEQAPSVYIVQEGDTLWDISKRFFNSPFIWPTLWEKNKHIKDPQWIYPGQPLLLGEKSTVDDSFDRSADHPSARIVKASPPKSADGSAAALVQSGVQSADTSAPEASEYLITREQVDSCGYILSRQQMLAREKEEQWGAVIDARENKISYSYPDLIYINKGKGQVSPGARFTVFRPNDLVIHPESGQEIGYKIQILGIIEVREVFEQIALAQIIKSFSEIHLNDRIRPYEQIPIPVRSKPKTKLQGMVIASEDGRINLSFHNIVFLDQGKKQKIQAGDCFSIYRQDIVDSLQERDQQSETVNEVIGELMVLKAEDDTSAALITKSKDAIAVGYRFAAQPE